MLGQAKLIASFPFPPAWFYASASNISLFIISHMNCLKFNMATVCVRVQSAEKCLVSWTIFQTESDSHSLLELFENVKNGRVSIIPPSPELSTARVEKVSSENPKRSLQ